MGPFCLVVKEVHVVVVGGANKVLDSRFVCDPCSVYVFAVQTWAGSYAKVAVANVVEKVSRVMVHVACASVFASSMCPSIAANSSRGNRVVSV